MYENKETEYFSDVRSDLFGFIPPNTEKLLELGAGSGNTLVKIKELKLAKEVVGFDIMEIENSNQKNPLIDKFYIGNIEETDLEYPEEYFNVMLCPDVLEHLINPWEVRDKLLKYLKPKGLFIVSLPNIQEVSIFVKVFLKGDFRYQDSGILDRTHLRFFCKKNVKSLLNTPELELQKIIPNFYQDKRWTKRKIANLLSLGLFRNYLTKQYLAVAQKK